MPAFSILVPTRARAQSLKFGLDSMGVERNNLEALVWIDDDDPQLDDYHQVFNGRDRIKLFIKPRVGYLNFHHMLNFLAGEASGDWLVLWNDDAYMDGPEWFDNFSNQVATFRPREEPVVLDIWSGGRGQNYFPVVSAKYFQILGRLSGHALCDYWVHIVASGAGVQKTIHGIKPRHRKYGHDDKLGDLKDETLEYVQALRQESKDLGARQLDAVAGRQADIEKIISWLNEHSRAGVV